MADTSVTILTPEKAAQTYLTKSASAAEDWVPTWIDAVNARPDPSDDPVLSWAAAMATALSSPVTYRPAIVGIGSSTPKWDGKSDTVFRWEGGYYGTTAGANGDLALYGITKPGGASQAAVWPTVVSFVTSATATVEIAGYSRVADNRVLIEVNGAIVSETGHLSPSGVGEWRLTLTFPIARVRTIRIFNTGDIGFSAFRVPTGQTITKPATAVTKRTAIVGDSFVNGAGGVNNTLLQRGASSITTFAPRLARLMGADEMVLAGIGGTGWIAGGTASSYSSRMADVLALSPHVLIFYGSINDGSNPSGLQAAVAAVLSQASAVPTVYVIGPLSSGYTPANEAIRAATLAAGRTFINMDGFINPQNQRLLLLPNDPHPNAPAHKAIAAAAYARMVRAGGS